MMRTYRGIVCEKKTKYIVFLTEKGEFLRGVPIGDPPEVGEETEFTLVSRSLIAGGKVKPRFVGAALVAAALLFFIMSSLSLLNDKVMAYVQLEAGTAMEFGVNREGNVISLRYLNESSNEEKRLSEWKDHSLLAVLERAILELSVRDDQIVVTTIYPAPKKERETRQVIEEAVQEVRGKHAELNWHISESTAKERTVANEEKMSIHQFKSTKNEKSLNGKQPAEEKRPIKEKSEQKQKDALQKPEKEIVPAAPAQQKEMEKKHSNKHDEQQNPSVENKQMKQNEHRSETVPPHADKKGPPDSSPSMNKQSNTNHGPPAKQQKENPSNEKKNPQNK
jgi:hypothetical protein